MCVCFGLVVGVSFFAGMCVFFCWCVSLFAVVCICLLVFLFVCLFCGGYVWTIVNGSNAMI